jgi:hypothetical protein
MGLPSGVRTGRYSKRDQHLMVQVGIQKEEAKAESARAVEVVQSRLLEAIDAAEAWADRRKMVADFGHLRDMARDAISRA